MSEELRERFSVGSDAYAAARPHYPRALFEQLAALSPAREQAWDCGTGSGQAAVALADWFEHVEATDVSPQQLAHAARHARVRYSVQPAEVPDFPDRSFELVCVAQALHWFDLSAFWPQVHRVLRPGGVFAAWTYTLPQLSGPLDRILEQRLLHLIEPYWAAQNRLAWDGYATVPFPFQPLALAPIVMCMNWSFAQFVDYLATWSATRLCREAHGSEFFTAFQGELVGAWGDPLRKRPVTMEFFCRVGRHAR